MNFRVISGTRHSIFTTNILDGNRRDTTSMILVWYRFGRERRSRSYEVSDEKYFHVTSANGKSIGDLRNWETC